MPQLTSSHTTSLYSTSGAFSEIQLVATSKGIVLDIQTQHYDVEGRTCQQYALAALPLPNARRLRDLLGEAIVAAENASPLHPGIWSDATNRAVFYRMGRRGMA